MTPAAEEFFYTLERDPGRLDAMRESIVEFLKNGGVEESTTSIVELCCYEAVANIIEHSPPTRDNSNIHLFCSIDGSKVTCQIIHYGPEFDLTRSPMPDINRHFTEGKNHGLGIYMIRTLMNEVIFTHMLDRNSLTLVKNLQ